MVPLSTPAVAHAGGRRGLIALLIGFAVVFGVLQGVATWTNSLLGEAGLVVAAATVGSAVLVERVLFGRVPLAALLDLGLGRPRAAAVGVAIAIGLILVGCLLLIVRLLGVQVAPRDGWPWLALGLFAQNGVAEELLFRGFLFRHLRAGRTFWRAAHLSLIGFVGAHLTMLATNDLPIVVASLLLAVATTYPLAWLFERGGNTLWAPALVHAATHTIKLVVYQTEPAVVLALIWIVACAVVPVLAFGLRPARDD